MAPAFPSGRRQPVAAQPRRAALCRTGRLGVSRPRPCAAIVRASRQDNEKHEDGLLCIAVPVFGRFDRVIAGLSIALPTMRYGADTKALYVALLQQAGAAISSRRGHHPASD
ncbi:hypothetical protein DEE38_22305 [Ralstonia pickettii]|nr:hypothetical protein [Ralstonia pickettii]OYU20895.1 MAG: hypothetical protein CFE42_21290 [Ralstonia sp. PBBBR1]MBB0037164.1 hypothetical protein [Ralstonia pickettii]MBB0099646.1 hypothetical protein [Ralstonia pickettii]MBB0109499.1 hypothetical protein [Ralstonia pickettii]